MRVLSAIADRIVASRAGFALGFALTLIFQVGVLRAQTQQLQSNTFTFALLGDLGYYEQHEPWVANTFAEIAKDNGLAFAVHVGDLSRPALACTDDFLKRRLDQFNALPHPLVFTPGDNDWTDCHGEQGAKGANPFERLAAVRRVMFADENSLGKRTIPLTRQSRDAAFAAYRENARWDHGGVTFATFHAVGSNNGRGRLPEGDAEFLERNTANLAWIRQSFAHATAADSRAIMLITQANLFPFVTPNAGNEGNPSGFAELREALRKEVAAFDKPVVLVHGDSHYFRIDNPYWQRPPRGNPGVPSPTNFTRVETFGTPNHHWLHVTVDLADPSVFTFRQRIVKADMQRP